MSSDSPVVTEGDILAHAIETIERIDWTRVAPVLSRLKLPSRDLDRIDQLLDKNRHANITPAERGELEKYLRVGNFLDLIRARALRELAPKQ